MNELEKPRLGRQMREEKVIVGSFSCTPLGARRGDRDKGIVIDAFRKRGRGPLHGKLRLLAKYIVIFNISHETTPVRVIVSDII